jgi:1,4-dihydroxy-2-naphthoyl-CoA synthase
MKWYCRSKVTTVSGEDQEPALTSRDYKHVLIERDGGITFVILNRPEQRNAMSPELHYEMEDAIDALAMEKDTKILVLTGAGESWCAGQAPMRQVIAGDGKS